MHCHRLEPIGVARGEQMFDARSHLVLTSEQMFVVLPHLLGMGEQMYVA